MMMMMQNTPTLIRLIATIVVTGSLLTACSSGSTGESGSSAASGAEGNSSSSSQNGSNAASPSPDASPESEAATSSPSPSPSTEPPAGSPSASPGASASPEATDDSAAKKPAATAKPSSKPAAKPSAKPLVTAKPGAKPSASSKPSAKPSAKPTQKPDASLSAQAIYEEMTNNIEQPPLMSMNSDDLSAMYGLDAKLLADFSVHSPMMNVKANEIAIFKVKSTKDMDKVEAGIKKRAASVQQTFETYLQDQYEIAKDYRIVKNGSYILFVISESADDLEKAFAKALG